MKIELRSNRKLYVWVFLFFAILFFICVITLFIAHLTEENGISIVYFVIFIPLTIIFLIPALLFKFIRRKKYVFTENEIFVYNSKNTLDKTIFVENIVYMRYYPQRLRHLISAILFDSFYDGVTMKIHIKEKDGKKHALGFIILKDSIRLKKMYPELLSLIYYVSATSEYP